MIGRRKAQAKLLSLSALRRFLDQPSGADFAYTLGDNLVLVRGSSLEDAVVVGSIDFERARMTIGERSFRLEEAARQTKIAVDGITVFTCSKEDDVQKRVATLRSWTTWHKIETYRQALDAYGVPRTQWDSSLESYIPVFEPEAHLTLRRS